MSLSHDFISEKALSLWSVLRTRYGGVSGEGSFLLSRGWFHHFLKRTGLHNLHEGQISLC